MNDDKTTFQTSPTRPGPNEYAKYIPPPPPTGVDKPVDPHGDVTRVFFQDRIATIAANQPRSLQAALGASEIGTVCDRQLAYRLMRTPICNNPEPLRAEFGGGFHTVMADGMRRLDPGGGRYLIEVPVSYRGVLGHVDLFDRFTCWATDYKTTKMERIRGYQRSGPPGHAVIQAQVYAAALTEAGEQVKLIVLVYIPRDSELHDLWTWTTKPNRAIADRAVDRLDRIRERLVYNGHPGEIKATPSHLCPWCANYRPNATNLDVACPGKDQPS